MTLAIVRPEAVDASMPVGLDDDPLAAHVARLVAEAPPLTDERRDRLALLLGPRQGRRAMTTATALVASRMPVAVALDDAPPATMTAADTPLNPLVSAPAATATEEDPRPCP